MRNTILLLLTLALGAAAREAKVVRYPSYHGGKVAFTHLADIWVANEDGSNLRRLTAHTARDVNPSFSPDGKWIAFSSDRNGNHDVFVIPAEGGQAKQLTFHSAADNVLGWTPDGRAVLFASARGDDFAGKLYTVPLEGGMERPVGVDMGLYGSFSPDGRKLAYNQKSQVYWRKYYRGAAQSDVMLMDIAAKKFTQLTDFDGMDSWPMYGRDGFIYFVSDRDGNGLTNIWRVSEKGGKAEKVTQFTSGDVRWPSISADGRTIVFEKDFGISKLDVASRKVTPLKFDIAAEVQENLTEVRSLNRLDDYDLAPSGARIVFSTHGEIFSAPVEEGDLVQITDSPARDKDPAYSPDGKWIAFVSDRSGREEIYLVPAGGGTPERITDQDNLKFGFEWSPDSKEIAFVTSDAKLYKYTLAAKQTAELASSRFGNIGGVQWSPDGKWIAFSKADVARQNDIYLIPSAGGAERKVTFDSYSEMQPRFSPDGSTLFFIRNAAVGQGSLVNNIGSAQLYAMWLEKQEKDPTEPEEKGTEPAGETAARRPERPAGPKVISIDFDGLRRRTWQVTRMPFGVNSYAVAPDSKTVVFATTEPATNRSVPVIYTIQADGRRLTRLTGGSGGDEEGGEGRGRGPGGGGFGGGMQLTVSRDGRSLFFREGGAVWSVPLNAGAARGPAAPAAAAAGGGGAQRRRVNFTAQVKINKPAEWAEMFDDAWRTMKYRFYDPNMHGMNWDAMRAKYQPMVEFVGDRQELLNLVNEMIGELNASHTGAAPGPGGERGAVTWHPGFEVEPDDQAGRYRVTHVYQDGPADKDWVKIKAGDYLLAIEGRPLLSSDNYWKHLNQKLNRKIAVTLNSKPADDGAWTVKIEPVSQQAYAQLRYERWVRERRAEVEKASGGRIGYLHIQAMNPPSLAKFEKEIREFRDKKALIIDQRWNGGGNIEQELLAILVQRPYQIWQPRGTEPASRPFAGFFGPKVVLQNFRSGSNAEMFPAGFKALGLGKTIGTPTAGAVIGTGSYSLIDGSTVRTPGVGVFLADGKRTNMENYGVKPDLLVENSPEDTLAGRDRQLEAAIAELLKEVGRQ
jgi:tricorn protease